jgi:outer membrane translocation and assembly module TamA
LTIVRGFIFAALLVLALPVQADVRYVVNGLDATLTENVLSHVDTVQFGPQVRFRPRDHDKVINSAIANARAALRPFGYYVPEITVNIVQQEGGPAIVELTIDAGPPIRVSSVDISVTGPGEQERRFQSWLRAWPLPEGAVLNQPAWEDHKLRAIEIANARGYLTNCVRSKLRTRGATSVPNFVYTCSRSTWSKTRQTFDWSWTPGPVTSWVTLNTATTD